MALVVNTNVSSINSQRTLMNVTRQLDVSYQRLSSGFRINSAKDDAAGLQISNRLSSQIDGLNQAMRNSNDGISIAQTAEGALDETTTMLRRIRTLAVQASNGSNTDSDRVALQKEVEQLMNEINRIASDTTFGGVNLLNGGTQSAFVFQVGADAGQTISFTMTAVEGNTGVSDLANEGGYTISGLASVMSNVGGVQAAGVSSITAISVTGFTEAQDVVSAMDGMIAVVDAKRTELGAIQNRFESNIRNAANVAENVSAARSRIRDVDFALETAALTRNQILQQASSTILAQANQRPQAALQLLG